LPNQGAGSILPLFARLREPDGRGARPQPGIGSPPDNPLRRLIQDPDRILAGLVRPGETALDLGCGMGYFSIPLARLVGPGGKVICVDLQEQMLAGVRRRAERAGVADRIRLHRTGKDGLGVDEATDFALAFWMLYEVPDQAAFLAEVIACVKPGSRLLVVEPRLHVSGAAFERSVAIARGPASSRSPGRPWR
jgi:SAM-dependent methyltransferase